MTTALAFVLIVAGVVGVSRVDADPSPQALLTRARAFVAEHRVGRFHGTVSVRGGGAERSPVGAAQTTAARVGGQLEVHRVHAVITDDIHATELVLVDRAVYVRDADAPEALPTASYVRADTQLRRLMRLRREQASSFDVAAVLAAAHSPTALKRHAGVTTLEADVDARRLFGAALAQHVQWATLRAVVDDTGRPRALTLLTRAEATITSRVQFTDWGGRGVHVAAPAPAQVHDGPSVAAANLASFKTAALLMPKTVPSGWELVSTAVLTANDTLEGCAQAELAYEDQTRPDAGYLYLYEFPKTCADGPIGASTPFTAGNYSGFAVTEDDPYVQITAGKTTVQAVTDLALDDLAATLSDLVPLALRSA